MLGDRRMLAVARSACVHGDPLAAEKDLDRAHGESGFDLGAGVPVGDGVKMLLDLDVIIDTDPPAPPLCQHIGFSRQFLQRWTIEGFQKMPSCRPLATDDPLLVQPASEFSDRGIQFDEAVKYPVAQLAQQPPLRQQNRHLDLRLVTRPPRPRRENGRAVMARLISVGPVDLWIVEAGADDRDPSVLIAKFLRSNFGRGGI